MRPPLDSSDGSKSKTASQVGDLLSLATQIPGQGSSGAPTSVPPGFELNASSVPPAFELSTWVPAADCYFSALFCGFGAFSYFHVSLLFEFALLFER